MREILVLVNNFKFKCVIVYLKLPVEVSNLYFVMSYFCHTCHAFLMLTFLGNIFLFSFLLELFSLLLADEYF